MGSESDMDAILWGRKRGRVTTEVKAEERSNALQLGELPPSPRLITRQRQRPRGGGDDAPHASQLPDPPPNLFLSNDNNEDGGGNNKNGRDSNFGCKRARGGWFQLRRDGSRQGFRRHVVLGPIGVVNVAIVITIGIDAVPSPFVSQRVIAEGKEGREEGKYQGIAQVSEEDSLG